MELLGGVGALLFAAAAVAFCEGTDTAERKFEDELDPAEVMLAVLLVATGVWGPELVAFEL